MPTNLQSMTWYPVKGINLRDNASKVPMDMGSDGLNVFVIGQDELCTRHGYTTAFASGVSGGASASASIIGLYSLYLSNGTKYELVEVSGKGIYKDEGTVASAQIITGMNQSALADYTQFLDKAIWVDASGNPYTWDGAASGRITPAASASSYVSGACSCATHLNKLFLAFNNSSVFRYSATGDLSVYSGTGTNIVSVDANNGQNMVALRSFSRNELIIFKQRSMYKYIGESSSNFQLVQIDSTIGCVAKKGIQTFKASTGGGVMIFPFSDGIYIYDGSTPQKISSYIQPLWDARNKARDSFMVSSIDYNYGIYLLSYSTGNYNDVTLIIDMLHPWTDEDGLHFPIYKTNIPIQSINSEITSANLQRLVFGGYANGRKYIASTDYSSDMGMAIDSYIVTPLMPLGLGLGRNKCLRRTFFPSVIADGTIDIYSETKDGTDWVLVDELQLTSDFTSDGIGTFEIGGSSIGIAEQTKINRVNSTIRAQRLKLKFEMISATDRLRLLAPFEFYFKGGATGG